MKIFFATCDELPNGTSDDQLLRVELVKRGHVVEFKSWTNQDVVWSDPDGVVIRSTWDYHKKVARFLDWAHAVETQNHLCNPFDTVKLNSSKRYLRNLKGAVQSEFASTEAAAIAAIEKLLETNKKVVIKPSVSATADLTYVISDCYQRAIELREILARSEVLIQPFIESIATDGEVSLIFFFENQKWEFSHAVLKLPKSGDFRVQMDFGGTVKACEVSDNLKSMAAQSLEEAKVKGLYARVDIVDWKSNSQIGELELIEPELFFRFSPESVQRFATVVTGYFKW